LLVPTPVVRKARTATKFGVVYFGSTAPAMDEALVALDAQEVHIDALRLRAFPFNDEVRTFIAAHDKVFVVEQNRDAQMRLLLMNELSIDPAKLEAVLHYDGTPITARFIAGEIAAHVNAAKVTPLKKAS
jgi:2-oxoglutarate ferredoxin oxidoreductase subunit alpha